MAISKNKKRTRKMIAGPAIPSTYREKKCVRITEADNGFTVSTYGPKGEQVCVARNTAEALRYTREMMGKEK